MRPFLRACWLASSARRQSEDQQPGTVAIGRYLELLAESPDAASAAYRIVAGGSTMESIKGRLDAMDADRYPVLPDHLVLTACDTLDDATALDAHIQDRLPALAAEFGPDALTTVVRGIYREITFTPGVEAPPADDFGPAVQLGTFSMRAPEDEWAITDWYRTRRLPSFAAMPGGIRVRRLVSVCDGPGKLGVLYEYVSLAARLEHFEPLEAVDHDEDRPTAAARTVHPPMSPTVAERL